ncbi:MAG: major capsid protein [Planctomycetota bacterium]|jgi:hypothetical protein
MAELEFGNRDNIFNMMQAFGPDGSHLEMAQNLVEVNDLVKDLPIFPANENLSHRDARWDSLPEASFIALGDAVTASFGRIQSYSETLGILKSKYQVPEDVLKAQGSAEDMARYRSDQERAHEEGMTQGLANALFNGTAAAAPEKLDGLTQRAPWNDVSNTTYVFDCGGTGSDLRSAWLIKPGRTSFHLLHPKHHPTKGVTKIDRGLVPTTVTTTDVNGTSNATRFDVMTDFEWWVGWNIKNQKAIKRICNIEVAYADLSEILIRKIVEARHIHTVVSSMRGAVNPAQQVEAPWFLYCDPYVYIQLLSLVMGKSNVRYSSDNPYKMSLPMIGDIIIRRCDALNANESQVT